MEAVGRLAGGIAHDFNNMLMVISGFSSVLEERFEPGDEEQQFVKEINNATERAAALTYQLLAFSRKEVAQIQIIDLNQAVDDAVKMLERLIGEDIELVVSLASAPTMVSADKGYIVQVLMNLAVNARDAMPGGGKLTIETAWADLSRNEAPNHDLQPGPCAILRVSDTGEGIDAETQPHIFEPFFTTKETAKGTGLGLSTVYAIVKQSGGSIRCSSEVGKGTVFSVNLPISPQGQHSTEARSPEVVTVGSETILVVEDEDDVRGTVASALKDAGYTVLETKNGVTALTVCESKHEQIGLIITDVIMPKMGGIALAEEVARCYPKIRVMFLSGYTETSAQVAELAFRADYLQKPVSSEELLGRVRTILDR